MALAAALALAAACGSPHSPSGPTGACVVAIDADPQSLDPRFGGDAASGRLADLMHVSLTRLGPDGGRVPDAAVRWDLLGPTTIAFHLREDLRFADGTRLTARDVAATYAAVLDPALGSPKRAALGPIAHVDAPDDQTVLLHLREPFPPVLDATGLAVLPARHATEPGEVTTGAGPFRLTAVARGERIDLEANPHWPGPTPSVPRVTLRIIPDAVVRALELERGGVHLVQDPMEPELRDRLVRRGAVVMRRGPGTSFGYLALNLRDPRLRQRRVRRALAHALDRRALLTVALGGAGRLATGLLTPAHWAYAPAPAWRFDPARARRLLDRAGLGDPDGPGPEPRFRIVYKTTSQPARRRLAQLVQAELADVGIAVDVRTHEWTSFFADVRAGRFEIAALSWVGVGDPDIFHLTLHSTMLPPEGYNRGHFRDPVMDRLTSEARRAVDPERRRALYARVQRRAARELPIIPLWWEDRVALHSPHLLGFTPSPSGDLRGLVTASFE